LEVDLQDRKKKPIKRVLDFDKEKVIYGLKNLDQFVRYFIKVSHDVLPLSLRGVKRTPSGTTILVASSLDEGQTFQEMRTPSRSSFCCMNS